VKKNQSTKDKGDAQGWGQKKFYNKRNWMEQDWEGRKTKPCSSLHEKSGLQSQLMYGSNISPFVLHSCLGIFSSKFCPRMEETKCKFLFSLSGNSRDMSV